MNTPNNLVKQDIDNKIILWVKTYTHSNIGIDLWHLLKLWRESLADHETIQYTYITEKINWYEYYHT
jgi:hypothetical protein